MLPFLDKIKSVWMEFDKNDFITPDVVGAEQGGVQLLDLNLKVQLVKHFLKQAYEFCKESDQMLVALVEQNLPLDMKQKMDKAIDNFMKNASDKDALAKWEKTVNEEFNSAPQRIYLANKLTTYSK